MLEILGLMKQLEAGSIKAYNMINGKLKKHSMKIGIA